MSDDNDPATTPKGNPVAARPMIGQHSPNRAALRFTRRFAAVLLGVGLASAPLALAAPLAIAADAPNTLKIAMTGDIDSLNPFTAITAGYGASNARRIGLERTRCSSSVVPSSASTKGTCDSKGPVSPLIASTPKERARAKAMFLARSALR